MEHSGKKPLLDRIIDFIFSNDERKWLLLVVLLGLILRVIVSSNLPPVADEMVHGTHAIGVSKLAPLSTLTQSQIWYYLTDYVYRIIGVSLLSARSLSVIFGSLSIIVVYLIASYLFNKRAGLVAAFLLSVSVFHITWTASYQDQTMMFFILMATFLFIKEYKEKKRISIIAAVFLAIAQLVKIITGVFVIVFGFFMLGIIIESYRKDKKQFRNNLKRAVIFIAILALAMTPIIAYNYFLYKDKGIVDLPLAQFLRINAEFYTGPGLHHEEGFVLSKLGRNLYTVVTHYFIQEDLLLFLIGAIGIIYSLATFRKTDKKFGTAFLLCMFFFSLCFIASSIVLQTHYTSFSPFFAIFGASFAVWATDHTKIKKYSGVVLIGLLCVILLYSLWSLHGPLTSKSGIDKLRTYVESSIDQNTLVIVDSRIYRGTIAWAFNDKNYIEASYFPQLTSIGSQGTRQPIKTIFIECVADDCGWGTVKDQPEFNQSMEELIELFKEKSRPEELSGGGWISGVRGEEENIGQPLFKIYQATLSLNPAVFESLGQTHSHFFYHIPRDEYPEQAFDNYVVNGVLDNLLNLLAYAILYILLLLAVISIGVPFYYLIIDSK